MYYATLAELRKEMGYLADEEGDDAALIEALDKAQEAIHLQTARSFSFTKATYKFDYPYLTSGGGGMFGRYSLEQWVLAMNLVGTHSGSLSLGNKDLISLVEVTNGDGTDIPLASIALEPANIYPKNRLWLQDGYGWLKGERHGKQSIQVEGLWGFHKEPAYAWVASRDALVDAIEAGDEIIDVSNSEGSDAWSRSPRFSKGNMIRIVSVDGLDEEYMDVVSITNNQLYVQRGCQGSTAQDWAATSKIDVFVPWRNVRTAHLRLAKWMMRIKDAGTDGQTGGSGGTAVPVTIPKDILQLLPARKMNL